MPFNCLKLQYALKKNKSKFQKPFNFLRGSQTKEKSLD